MVMKTSQNLESEKSCMFFFWLLNHRMTAADEMCNFYIMYWADAAQGTLDHKSCFSTGPPN